ncbi:MAG: DUF1109 domain-containing protein [Sphingomonadaceae bacterium]|nr:DUF1109 domain-containing protein [Sphingomonadaceae bacterium]
MNGDLPPKPVSGLIDELTADLEPVHIMRGRDGMALALAALAVTVVAVALIAGLREGLMSSAPPSFFLIANLLLLLLGLAAATAVVSMAGPRVGNRHDAPKWALAMVTVLPLAALASLTGPGQLTHALGDDNYGWQCAAYGSISAMLVAAALTAWLRRGAPVSPERAGLWTGVAAGALGSAAYGLHCPIDSMAHLGIWHMLPVAVCGALGRVALPPLLRW